MPNNSTLAFGASGCYRVEGTLEIRGRSGLTFLGNGARFLAYNPPSSDRSMWRFIESSSTVLRNMTVKGSYTNGGVFTSSLQSAHGIDLRGTGAEIADVAVSDFAGDCVYFGLGYSASKTRSSGSFHDSTCTRIGRNAVAVTAGDNILVQHVTTSAIGLNAFDVEPNALAGFGSNGVVFDSNTIGSYYLYAFAVVEDGPVSNQAFTNNRAVGAGLRIGVVQPGGTVRAANITIKGNSSDTAIPWPMEFHGVDGLTVTGNVVPTSNTPMATVDTSCGSNLSGNSYPGGSTQVLISPWVCTLSPASGQVGTRVAISGSGFTGATAVKFNGIAASFAVESDARITAMVPSGATSGTLSVKTPLGTATSTTSFIVTVS